MSENNMIDKNFKKVVESIKNEIYKTQTLIMTDANKRLLDLYFYVGKIVNENSSWGNKFIESLSTEMKIEFPNIKGFSVRNIKNMKKFYQELSTNEKVQMASAQIPWSHTNLYERQGKTLKDNNFNKKLLSPYSDMANDMQKDPYIFNLPLLKEKYAETELENALVEKIKDTLIELRKRF